MSPTGSPGSSGFREASSWRAKQRWGWSAIRGMEPGVAAARIHFLIPEPPRMSLGFGPLSKLS